MKTFKRMLGFVTPLRHYIPEYVIWATIGIIFGLINFAMLIPLLETLFGTKPENPVAVLPDFSFTITYFKDVFSYYFQKFAEEEGKVYALGFVCTVIASATLIANVARYLSVRVMVRLRMNILERIRNKLYDHITRQSLSFFHQRRKGDLLSVMTNDVAEVEYTIANSIQILLRDPFIIIFTFFALFYISVKLTLFTLVFFPISGFLVSYISKQLRKKGYYSQEMLGKLLNISEESLGGVRIIKGFTAENYMMQKFAAISRNFSRLSKSIYNQRELASPVSEALGVILVVVLVMVGGYMILESNGELTPAEFITYLGFYFTILQPAKNISNAITNLQRGIVSGERIFSLLDEANVIEEKPDAKAITSFEKDLVYKNVTFRYEQQDVLKNIELKIEKGTMVALVGKSGAGKSTMADLLPRFYDVSEGQLLIDGKDVRDLKLNDLRQLMGIVSQEAILFNDTVFNNIAFGQPDADPQKVIEAAKIANAHEFIEQLENGYDTTIGDRGSKLSGGQRQRMTIARAIFKNPPVLILDEATSALDTESEKLVQEALEKLMQNRTTIVIAHRLSTIQHAHEIIVMDKGEIVERGRHDALLAHNGIYRKLVEMQELK